MRPLVIIELDPVSDRTACVCEAFEPMTMDTLLFQRSDQAFHHSVLLRTVGRDELLLQAIAADKFGVGTRREDQTVVPAKKERGIHLSQGTDPGD